MLFAGAMTMNRWLGAAALPVTLMLALGACQVSSTDNNTAAAAPGAASEDGAVAKLAKVQMTTDTAFLSDEERQVVNLLNQAAGLMSEIYKRQATPGYDQLRASVASDPALLDRFDTFFGPWDSLDEDKPFVGTAGRPAGAGFYPTDLTKEAFDAYLKANPGEAEALTSPYTVVQRKGDRLVAVPYSKAYAQWLEPAAKLLEQAAADHHQSQPQELPHPARQGVSHRRLFRQRTGVDGFEGHPDRGRDRALRNLYRRALRARRPRSRRSSRCAGSERIRRARQIQGRAARHGAQSAGRGPLQEFQARVRIADRRSPTRSTAAATMCPGSRPSPSTCPTTSACARPRAPRRSSCRTCSAPNTSASWRRWRRWCWSPTRPASVTKKYMPLETLFHELSHSLGPGTIKVGGRADHGQRRTEGNRVGLEEAKADVMGVVQHPLHDGQGRDVRSPSATQTAAPPISPACSARCASASTRRTARARRCSTAI